MTDSPKNISLKEVYARLPRGTLTYSKTGVTSSEHPQRGSIYTCRNKTKQNKPHPLETVSTLANEYLLIWG
ncbi:hypothetical protein I79_007191 [Cricetulus griseus]|uniref:Uncharacterized protein n=1 Tax=Cricetulus griseus TaxID=10029 RepID=G3H9W0_CRIGR|nr:hypothetical protein I79_007191 [Cricetulus griseus]